MGNGRDKHGPKDAPKGAAAAAASGFRPRVQAAQAVADHLAKYPLRKSDTSAPDLVAEEAAHTRSVLAGIIADLQPLRDEDLPLDGSLSRLMDMAGPETARELVIRLDADLVSVAEGLRAAGAKPDWTALRSQSHILIALAGAAGAQRLQDAAEALNAIAHGTDPAELNRLLPYCLTLIIVARDRIRSLPLPDVGPAP